MIPSRKVLLIRLSSLGDVILAMSALESSSLAGAEVHWLTSPEYVEILENHPRISKVIAFDRREGLGAWLTLWKKLAQEGYSDIFDLHRSLRTRIAKIFFRKSAQRWKMVSKERFHLDGFFIFKKMWPKSLRPTPCTRRFSLLVGGTGDEKPSLVHLVEGSANKKTSQVCVMPSSKWPGKNWPVSYFADVVENFARRGIQSVVLGSDRDEPSRELVALLIQRRVSHQSAIGKLNLKQTATALASSRAYFGNDTGLGHLAEAVGVPAWVMFGPTTPEMGFGPWRSESRSFESDLWCRPCSKDGNACFRIWDRYRCMKDLSARDVSGGL